MLPGERTPLLIHLLICPDGDNRFVRHFSSLSPDDGRKAAQYPLALEHAATREHLRSFKEMLNNGAWISSDRALLGAMTTVTGHRRTFDHSIARKVFDTDPLARERSDRSQKGTPNAGSHFPPPFGAAFKPPHRGARGAWFNL